MSSRNAIGVAPLVTGLVLVSQSFGALTGGDSTLWVVSSVVGGCAAALVGVGILFGWGEFDPESGEADESESGGTGEMGRPVPLALAGVALCAFLAGAAVTVL
ncbi:hypothetical protein ACFO0N_11830 [Halobium salinum]|uniref:Uncharacterized protein n=1 Tax=Halobium salinum TaxID=1364940 RepID=A0ABD5PDA2_9EURY|nr:hypothetical protein [Halobium salinum]